MSVKSREKPSIHLSYLLRHAPEAAGLDMDHHGWVSVSQLISNVNASGKAHLTVELLKEIVDKRKLPSLKDLRAEYAELLTAKKAAYPEYYRVKAEYRDLLAYQANLAGLFGIEPQKQEPQKEHQHEEK